MKILAIDTSGSAVSVAVAEKGRLLSHIWLRHGRTHSEALMPCIQHTLSGLSMGLCDFDAFAAISGPGSFTGLRIGIATIKAIAYANNARAAAIPTHDALAYNLSGYADALICPIMEARNGRVYQAIYRASACFGAGELEGKGTCEDAARITRLADTQMIGVEEAAARIKEVLKHNSDIGRIIFNGDAANTYLEYFRPVLDDYPCSAAGEPELYQSAAPAALLACEAAESGALVSPEALAPNYYNSGYITK